jgi:hypothetical protein
VSVYQDLCGQLARARERARERRARFAGLFEAVGASIVEHLGIPEEAHEWCALEVESEPESGGVPLVDAMAVDEEGAWHVGLRILVRVAGDPASTLPLVLDLRLREQNGRAVLSFSDEGPRHLVHPDRSDELAAVAQDAERRLRAWMEENLDRVVGAAGGGEQFGQYL